MRNTTFSIKIFKRKEIKEVLYKLNPDHILGMLQEQLSA